MLPCGFASLMGFVPGRCLQGHGKEAGVPREDESVLVLLQEDPQGQSPGRMLSAALCQGDAHQILLCPPGSLGKPGATGEPKTRNFRGSQPRCLLFYVT